MKAKRIFCRLVCIIIITAGFVVLGIENATSVVTRVDDPFPGGGDLAVFSSEISVEFPLAVGHESKIDVDVHNLGITAASTWHLGDYVEYDFFQGSGQTLDIEIRIRSYQDPTSTNVQLDGADIADFNSMPGFEIVTIHDITILSGVHTIRITQASDTPSPGCSLSIDWLKIGPQLIEGEFYDRSDGTDSNPDYRGVDAIYPSKISTKFYIDGNLLAENQGVGTHTNSVPGDSPYPEVDFLPNNSTTNTSTTWTPSLEGYHTIEIEVLAIISSDFNLTNSKANITVYVGIPPPKLYINTSQDGKDAVLNWDPPSVPGIDHYLIYRAKSQTDFDFNNVWINTLRDAGFGESLPIPLRTMWNDSNSTNPENATNYEEQYYYIIRAVNTYGQASRTSRTVGKWTKAFSEGVSTFSIPLEPFWNLTADDYLMDMGATYIKWMDSGNHIWVKHGDGSVNDGPMRLGEGYEVKFAHQTNYTFCGMPAAMISYSDGSGFLGFDSDSEAKSLKVEVDSGGNVNLSWKEPASMGSGDRYEVYYSNSRDGFFGTLGEHYFYVCSPIDFGTNFTTHNGALANNPRTRLYYMVVPFNSKGIKGASTYSIGIWTEKYLVQYDTFGIPLKLNDDQTADWYCSSINHTVGINYFNISEQRWCWHSTRMPAGAYDPVIEMTNGYQISTSNATKFIFIGI
ncbi:MAG: hypothetical protein JSV56_04060 [Methanomassiliicoccales archaeon]|nr:MAG: hypothetical protein JSV56_04060 [Methanomassiliicoccales archaeon]